jgi:hypothetical protein
MKKSIQNLRLQFVAIAALVLFNLSATAQSISGSGNGLLVLRLLLLALLQVVHGPVITQVLLRLDPQVEL